jgi:hypothetical protein
MASRAKSNRRIVREGRRYWSDRPTSNGKAAGIGWAPHSGSWTRCVARTSRFLGPRAKGYCALRMKEAIGIYPGSRANRGGSKGKRR